MFFFVYSLDQELIVTSMISLQSFQDQVKIFLTNRRFKDPLRAAVENFKFIFIDETLIKSIT